MGSDSSTSKESIARIASEWAAIWAGAVEGMTGERVQVQINWDVVPKPETLWWRHKMNLQHPLPIWIGADAICCELVGKKVLDSAGINDVSGEEIRSTFLELLAQAVSGWAAVLGRRTGGEIFCDGPTQLGSPDPGAVRFAIMFQFADGVSEPVFVAVPAELSTMLSTSPELPRASSDPSQLVLPPGAVDQVPPSRTLDLLLEVELPVSVSFGRAKLPLRDVLKLTSGAIVELNRSVNEPVEIIVNNCVIARGEVVVIDGYYGVRIQQIVSRQERLRSLN